MRSLEHALRNHSIAASKTTLTIISALGSNNSTNFSVIESTLDRTVEVILEQLTKFDSSTKLQVACCLETNAEVALAARTLRHDRVSPAFVAPIDPSVLLNQITVEHRSALSTPLGGAITVLDHEFIALDQAR